MGKVEQVEVTDKVIKAYVDNISANKFVYKEDTRKAFIKELKGIKDPTELAMRVAEEKLEEAKTPEKLVCQR